MILLLENNDTERLLLACALTERGCRVRDCSTASAALTLMLIDPPGLLIADLIMSPVSGVSLLREMAAVPALAGVKVIVATALPDPLPELGLMATVIRKPFTVEELIGVIARVAPDELRRGA